MAGRIWIPPYRPSGAPTRAVPGGGYIEVDAGAGAFSPSPLLQPGLQVAEGAAGFTKVMLERLGRDNEAVVKTADARLGETEQMLLFDPQSGYLNTQGQAALTQAPAAFDAYGKAQAREASALTDDDQRRMFDELSSLRLASFTEQVRRHGEVERRRWHDAAGDGRIAQARRDAGLYWSDDALLRRAVGTERVELRDKAERHGWDSALTEATLRRQTSGTLVAVIEAAAEHDPERAQVLRTRYAAAIEEHDRTTLDALLGEALTRRRAEEASAAILSGSPQGGQSPPLNTRTGRPTLEWQLQQAGAIIDSTLRVATTHRLRSADAEAEAAAEARARALGEQVLARVLKDGLTDPSRIPVREWLALDAERRHAIETLLEHNLRGNDPAPNAALFDALSAQMIYDRRSFERRDLVPLVSHLPTMQWQRFRELQEGLRRDDPATDKALYAFKRGLRIGEKMLRRARSQVDDAPSESDALNDVAANYRMALIEEVDAYRRVNGQSPDSDAIRELAASVELAQNTGIPREGVPPAANDNRDPACTEAAYMCLSAPGKGSGWGRACQASESACNVAVGRIRSFQRQGADVEGVLGFPDGTRVVVPPLGVRAFVIPRGRSGVR